MEFNPDALHGAEAIIISSETSKFIQRRENHGTLAYTAHEHRVVRPQTINNLCCAPREERPQNLCQLARLNSLIMRYRRTLSALLIALIISESGRTFVIWLMVHSKIYTNRIARLYWEIVQIALAHFLCKSFGMGNGIAVPRHSAQSCKMLDCAAHYKVKWEFSKELKVSMARKMSIY